jgi:Transposase domain (DUF772)
VFRVDLEAALSRSDRSKGGGPPYDAVLMFKVLVLQTLSTLSDDQTEYQLKDRLSFMRFVGLALHDPVPGAKTIWLYREQRAWCSIATTPPARCGPAPPTARPPISPIISPGWPGSMGEPRPREGNARQRGLQTRKAAGYDPDRPQNNPVEPAARLKPPRKTTYFEVSERAGRQSTGGAHGCKFAADTAKLASNA